MMCKLIVGMVVRNAVYGQMVVCRVEGDEWAGDNKIECRWWDGMRYVTSHFSADELEPV